MVKLIRKSSIFLIAVLFAVDLSAVTTADIHYSNHTLQHKEKVFNHGSLGVHFNEKEECCVSHQQENNPTVISPRITLTHTVFNTPSLITVVFDKSKPLFRLVAKPIPPVLPPITIVLRI
jgi:hypothetical protein